MSDPIEGDRGSTTRTAGDLRPGHPPDGWVSTRPAEAGESGHPRAGGHPVSAAEALAEAELSVAPSDRLPARLVTWLGSLAPYVAIGAGGALGANVRFLVGEWTAARWGAAFPWGTLAINVTGSFLIGLYLTLVTERFAGRATTRLFFVTGFLGAYTTFATFSVETVTLLQHGALGAAIGYVAASLVLGFLAVAVGIVLAHAL